MMVKEDEIEKMINKTLIIFDCDGTLVDTEYLSSYAYAAALHKISDTLKIYDAAAIESEFKGMKMFQSIQILIDRYDLDITVPAVIDGYMEQVTIHRAKLQKNIAGVKETLEALQSHGGFEFCVASNGEQENVIASLEHAGLMQYFNQDTIFNASMVAEPKPSPLLFLHAAEKCGYQGQECIVVEDTAIGTRAGKAANFYVYGTTACASAAHKKDEEIALHKAKADIVLDNFMHIGEDIIAKKTKSYLMSA
jgi:HAD superfamily hydrolase (TIGR01509 family)|tara:strand:+ start:162478 stop:163230 length:753 start_codon:yes stop_codon:yes gene_type:complete